MQKDEEIAFLAHQQDLAAANQSILLVAEAKRRLDASDITYLRCAKAGVAWPPEWQAYVLALRSVVAGETSTIPELPNYPPGT